jgi:hypothetical protein
MNDEDVRVDTEALNLTLGVVGNAANRLAGISGMIKSFTQDYSGAWGTGNDPAAQKFAAGYLPAEEELSAGVQASAAAYTGASDGVDTMVKGYTKTEEDNIEAASGNVSYSGDDGPGGKSTGGLPGDTGRE